MNGRRTLHCSSLKVVVAIGAIKTAPIAGNTCEKPFRCRTGTSPGGQAFPRVACPREQCARRASPVIQREIPCGVCSLVRKNWSANSWRLMAHLLSRWNNQPRSALARNRTWSSTFARSRANPAHPKDDKQHPVEESNPFYDVRSVACYPTHSPGMARCKQSTGDFGGPHFQGPAIGFKPT